MAEATQRLHQAQVRASMGMAVNVLARQAAIKATKRQLQAQGLKPLTSPTVTLSSELSNTSPPTARS
jgi:hypothetical protein